MSVSVSSRFRFQLSGTRAWGYGNSTVQRSEMRGVGLVPRGGMYVGIGWSSLSSFAVFVCAAGRMLPGCLPIYVLVIDFQGGKVNWAV